MTGNRPLNPLAGYFSALDAGDVDLTVDAFAETATYTRPWFGARPKGSPRLTTIAGREALRAFFEKRGIQPVRHIVTSFVVDGARVFAEGLAQGLAQGVVTGGIPPAAATLFLATATMDATGRIERYLVMTSSVDALGSTSTAGIDRPGSVESATHPT